MSAKKVTLSGILISLALTLSYMERFFPIQMLIPLPGVKLGFANIVTMMALYFLGTRNAFLILVLRCFLGAVFGGGASGLAFSMTGGLTAMTMMAIAKRIPWLSVYGVSVLGAAAHHVGQIAVAMTLMGSMYVIGYLPYLLIVSVFTGFATGTACAYTFRALEAGRWNENMTGIRRVSDKKMMTR